MATTKIEGGTIGIHRSGQFPKINRYFDEQLGKDELSSIDLGGA